MSKQVYIDENGNEIQVSGTVNTADMMPMSGNDSTKVSEAIGSLSTLTTTDKSSIVGAVNEVVSDKQNKINEGYDIMGLSTPSGITRQNGGYCKIGNLVIVNVRLNLTNNVASETDIISGFPLPVGSNNMVAVTINKDAYAVMTTSGAIRVVGNSLTSGICVLSTAYMTATT